MQLEEEIAKEENEANAVIAYGTEKKRKVSRKKRSPTRDKI